MAEKSNIIVISDLHINSTVALCPPRVNLDDGGTYHPSRGQRFLIDAFNDFVLKVQNLEGKKTLIINGDVGELDTKRRSNQLITMNKSTILDMVIDTLAPLVDKVDHVIIIRGTVAHTGKSQWLEEALAGQYDHVVVDKTSKAKSWYHFRGVIGDVRVDAAHHATMGYLPWTAPNSANRVAAMATWLYMVEYKQPPPHLLFRSHNHRCAESNGNYPVRVFFTPAWTLITEYGYRLGRELTIADIGGVINGEIIRYRENKRRIWAIKI